MGGNAVLEAARPRQPAHGSARYLADFFKGSFGHLADSPPRGIMGHPDLPLRLRRRHAKAAVASIFSATQSPDAMEAFGFLAKSVVQAKGAVSFFGDPTWNVAGRSCRTGAQPQFRQHPHHQLVRQPDAERFRHQRTRSTDQAGDDAMSGGKGIDILFGGDGDDGVNGRPRRRFPLRAATATTGSPAAAATTTLKGNAGSDAFVFGADAGGRDRIGDFRPGTDFLEIKSDLNGNGLKSASQVLGTATTDADSNAVLPPWRRGRDRPDRRPRVGPEGRHDPHELNGWRELKGWLGRSEHGNTTHNFAGDRFHFAVTASGNLVVDLRHNAAERIQDAGVEMAPQSLFQIAIVLSTGIAVRPLAGQRIEDIGDGEDPGGEGNAVSVEATR